MSITDKLIAAGYTRELVFADGSVLWCKWMSTDDPTFKFFVSKIFSGWAA